REVVPVGFRQTTPTPVVSVAENNAVGGVLVGNQSVFAPALKSVVINGGAKQRSKVSSIRLTFNKQVNVNPAAIHVVRLVGKFSQLMPAKVQSLLVNGKTVVLVTFPKLKAGSLPDGNFQLVVNGNLLSDLAGQKVDADGNGKPGGTKLVKLFRLFGDA